MNVLVGAWPVGAILAAVVLRLLEHRVLHPPGELAGSQLTRSGELLVELLSVTSQAFVVAAGVGFGIAWSPFRW